MNVACLHQHPTFKSIHFSPHGRFMNADFFSGERTFGVLTKIDLMDQGTDAVDVSLYSLSLICLYIIVYSCLLKVCLLDA